MGRAVSRLPKAEAGGGMCLEATVEKKNISRVLGTSQAFQVALVVKNLAVNGGDIEKPV